MRRIDENVKDKHKTESMWQNTKQLVNDNIPLSVSQSDRVELLPGQYFQSGSDFHTPMV